MQLWLAVLGVEFFLRGRSIPTDGSGHLLITDISLYNRQTSTSDEEALICFSSRHVGELNTAPTTNKWYLDLEVVTTTNTVTGERISEGSNDRGWTVNRDIVHVNGTESPFHRVVRLNRVSEIALEGKFTCHITDDSNNNKFLLILYTSEYNCATCCVEKPKHQCFRTVCFLLVVLAPAHRAIIIAMCTWEAYTCDPAASKTCFFVHYTTNILQISMVEYFVPRVSTQVLTLDRC